jgi:hypothetical protein
VEKKPSDKQDTVKTYTLADFPKEIQKKVTLLQHFRSYLDGNTKPPMNVHFLAAFDKRNRGTNLCEKVDEDEARHNVQAQQ